MSCFMVSCQHNSDHFSFILFLIMDIAQEMHRFFWKDDIWFHGLNVTWDDFESKDDGIVLPRVSDLLLSLPVALFLCCLRFVWGRFIVTHVGRYFNLKQSLTRKVPQNDLLDLYYKNDSRLPNRAVIVKLGKKLDWTPRQVERWWRRKMTSDRPSLMKKITESSFRFLFYFMSFWSGLYLLLDKPWLWETAHCFYDWPRQHVDKGIWSYYLLELSFYWSQLLVAFYDTKKDSRAMIIHHLAAIIILHLSWSLNLTRVGSLIMLTLDASDIALEAGKMATYIKYTNMADVLFVVFILIWIPTRLVFYPFWIMRTSIIDAYSILRFTSLNPIHVILVVLLLILLILQIMWSIRILKCFKSIIIKGHVNDERSESELSTSEDDKTEANHQSS